MKLGAAHVFLDDVDVSRYVTRVVLTADAEAAIRAEVTFYLTGVDVDVPAVITPMLTQANDG